MRKIAVGALLAFALCFTAGAMIAPPPADAGFCYYTCICSVPHKCCGSSCKPVSGPIQCPQVNDC